MRDDTVSLSLQEVTMCKEILLKFYYDKYLSTPEDRHRTHLDKYTHMVFQLPFETMLIETIFSIMNYNKHNKGNILLDNSVASVIHTNIRKPILSIFDKINNVQILGGLDTLVPSGDLVNTVNLSS